MFLEQSALTKFRPCPICLDEHLTKLKVLHQGNFVSLSICRNCRLEFINPLPESTEDQVRRYYQDTEDSDANQYMDDPSRNPDFLINLKLIERAVGSHAKLLDFGCGKGQFTQLALDSGFNATGYDVAEAMVKQGKEQNRPLFSGPLDSFLNAHQPFDAIHSDQVFEHLFNPTEVLHKLKDCLSPKGIIVLSVPLRQSIFHEYRFMEHLNYFSETALRTLLAKAGFRVFHIRKGLPLIRRYHRLFGKVPPLGWVRFWEKATSLVKIYGWSIVAFARKGGN